LILNVPGINRNDLIVGVSCYTIISNTKVNLLLLLFKLIDLDSIKFNQVKHS